MVMGCDGGIGRVKGGCGDVKCDGWWDVVAVVLMLVVVVVQDSRFGGGM